MLVLGLCGGPDLIDENLSGYPPTFAHDAACVLLEDGEVVFALEEERVNRIKHTNKMPVQALRGCLESHGVQFHDIDLIAYYSHEETLKVLNKRTFLADSLLPEMFSPATFIQHILRRGAQSEVDPAKLFFVHHHHAHAMSAFARSGYETSLITTFDGQGDGSSGMILTGEGNTIEPLVNYPVAKSLGLFYVKVIAFLGYRMFDEYKVMGLAPYGDPHRFRHIFQKLYTLLPNGDYEIHNKQIQTLFELGTPRRKSESFTQTHMDIAASLQETLEEIVFHVLGHYKQETGQKNLCLAGGVAHNCTLNGKILRSRMFENVFVQPAAHDAGAALGAALYAYFKSQPDARKPGVLKHVYWGTDIGDDSSIRPQLNRWQEFIEIEKVDDIARRTAELLGRGSVIGWVQGRSEFGPRALGNRSIIADPRPAENKSRINQMVKKREGYRPFAPSVLEEEVDQFFDVPAEQKALPFMTFVLDVKEEKRGLLGAITHVDGTARVQTVSRETNERYWKLIKSFQEFTGIPILLNTSFNNNVEPIVDSVEDAIVCFLTTKLDYLVVGDYLARKKEKASQHYLHLKPSLPPYISLHQVKKGSSDGKRTNSFHISNSYNSSTQIPFSAELFQLLGAATGDKTIEELLAEIGMTDETGDILQKLIDLWSARLILLKP